MEKTHVSLSTNSWHYKLMKLVLGSNTPKPYEMHNLCPYFWLLVFSILTCWFVIPIRFISRGLFWIFDKMASFLDNQIRIPTANSWYQNLTDMDVYTIFRNNDGIAKLYLRYYGEHLKTDEWGEPRIDTFVSEWWEKKYKKKAYRNDERTKAFQEWHDTMRNMYIEMQKELRQPSKIRQNIDNVYENIGDWSSNFKDEILSWTTIIKWTKRIVGLIITSIGLFITYFVVNILGRSILFLIENWDWSIFLVVILGMVAALIFILILKLLTAWVKLVKEKGIKLWYVKLTYYPSYYILFLPLKLVLYHITWKFILVNLFFLIIGSGKLIWAGILSFGGIFGEYFGASYTDYCPGIQWKEEDEE